VNSVPDHLKKENDNNRLTILAVDTATSTCSVALADPSGTIAELNYFGKQTHAKHLATMVDRLLERADMSLAAVAAFAVDAGPGTFTGLRIGMAAVKGLAAATRNRPSAYPAWMPLPTSLTTSPARSAACWMRAAGRCMPLAILSGMVWLRNLPRKTCWPRRWLLPRLVGPVCLLAVARLHTGI